MAVIDDLVAYWSLDEGSGNAIDAHDDNDLTDTNTVAATTGKVSGARDFDSGSTEYFTLGDNADLSLGTDTAFTFAGWVQNEVDFTAGNGIFGKCTTSGADAAAAYVLQIRGAPNYTPLFSVGNGSTFASVEATGVFMTPAATWFFFVAKHDPVANQISLRINNGTPVTASWSGGTQNEASAFFLGFDNFGVAWNGLMDEWGFWKKATSDAEETWLYNSGSGRSYADIVAEAGSGTVVPVFLNQYRQRWR